MLSTLATAILVASLGAMGAAGAAEPPQPETCRPHWSTTVGQPGMDVLGAGSRWVYYLSTWDDGTGSALYAGGYFGMAGGRVARGIAKWDGFNWRPLGEGINGLVMAITNFDDGSGDALYVGGVFHEAGGKPAHNVAKWDPRTREWSALGDGLGQAREGDAMPSVIALGAFDDGNGPALYAGGTFTSAGGKRVDNIAKWDGNEWIDIGGSDDAVRAFTVFDDGSGPALYAGGNFSRIGSTEASRIARWDGETWHALPGRFTGSGIRGMTVHNDGTGPGIYVCGVFQRVDDIECNGVARWDPATGEWSSLAGGTNERVVTLLSFDDGTGDALYVVGWFTTAGGERIDRIGRWDGREWSRLEGADLDMVARGLAKFPDPETGRWALYVGGGFTRANDQPSSSVAAWVGCCEAPPMKPSNEPLGREPTEEDRAGGFDRSGRGEPGRGAAPTRGTPPTRGAQPQRGREAPQRGTTPQRGRDVPQRGTPPVDD